MPNPCTRCGSPALVQWRRRLTDSELADLITAETSRREELLQLADAQLPPPVFGPMPSAADSTIGVFACAEHAIHLDLAARVHAAHCQAPHPQHLPACNCEPEPHPAPYKPPAMVTLPTGWTVPAPA